MSQNWHLKVQCFSDDELLEYQRAYILVCGFVRNFKSILLEINLGVGYHYPVPEPSIKRSRSGMTPVYDDPSDGEQINPARTDILHFCRKRETPGTKPFQEAQSRALCLSAQWNYLELPKFTQRKLRRKL